MKAYLAVRLLSVAVLWTPFVLLVNGHSGTYLLTFVK
jgi:hypothetical protein